MIRKFINGRFTRHVFSFLLISCSIVGKHVEARDWPAEPISILVGYAPGGPVDIVARVMARYLSEELGKPVIVENKPGAGSTIAAAQVAHAPPNGYTLLLTVPGLTSAESLFPNRNYDLNNDFSHVSLIGTSPNWLLTSAESDFKNVHDVEKLASVAPEKYSYGHGATGGVSHLTSELLKISKNLKILEVPYRGNGPALIDLIASRVDLVFDQPISSETFVASGKLRPLAVTSTSRLSAYPKVPTMTESGYADMVVEIWYGLAYPAETPKFMVKKMNEAIGRLLSRNDVRTTLLRSGVTPLATSPEQTQKRIKNEIERWGVVISKAKIPVN